MPHSRSQTQLPDPAPQASAGEAAAMVSTPPSATFARTASPSSSEADALLRAQPATIKPLPNSTHCTKGASILYACGWWAIFRKLKI